MALRGGIELLRLRLTPSTGVRILSAIPDCCVVNGIQSQLSLSQKSELVMGMSLGVPSKRHQLGRC